MRSSKEAYQWIGHNVEHHEIGRQPVPRHLVRVLPQRRSGYHQRCCPAASRRDPGKVGVAAEPVRRQPGGQGRQKQDVLFRRLRGFPAGPGETQAANTPSYQELIDPLHSDLATIYGLTAVSPIAQNWLVLFPKPPATSTCAVCVYTGTQNRTQFSNIFDVRIDQNFNPATLLYARYSYNNVATFTPGIVPTTMWPARRSAPTETSLPSPGRLPTWRSTSS